MALGGYPDNAQPEDVLAAARRAARRAGMTLGEWLDAEARRQQASDYDEGSIDDLRERLAAMERQRPARSRHTRGEESADDLVKRIEERLMAISQRMEGRVPQAAAAAEPRDEREMRASRPAEAWREPPRRDPGSRHTRIGGEPIRDLKDAIAEIAARQSTLEHEFDTAVSSYADRVDHRIDAMAERLERSLEGTSPAAAIRDIETEVRAISARLDRDRSGPATDLREEMIDLVRRLDELPARLADDIAPRLEDTARRLDTAARSELDSIRAEMREIAQEMERGQTAQFEALRGDISKLTEQVASGAAAPAGEMQLAEADRAQISAMREDIRELTAKVDGANRDEFAALREDLRLLSERVDTVPNERLRELDRYLSALAEKLEAEPAAAPAGESTIAGLAEIERRIGELAERFESPGPELSDLTGIDSRLGELMRRIDEDRNSAELLAALKDEFGELREKMAGAEDRSQATLAAVNDTLSKIVDRLTDLEGEVEEASEERRRPRAERATEDEPMVEPELDPDDLVGRIEAVTRSFEREPDDNTPLAPGSGRPRGADDEPTVEEPSEPDEPKSDRASFIAAARRAAQAASTEAAAAPKATAADRMAPTAIARKVGPLARHKRLLLIGAAMAGLVLASLALANYLDSSTDVSSLEAEPAAVEAVEAPQAGPIAEETTEASVGAPRIVTTERDPAIEAAAPVAAPQDAPAAEAEEPLTTGSIRTGEDEKPVEAIEMPPEGIGSERLRRAAAEGDPAAQYEVGARYTDGHGVAQDFGRAVYWYRLAAAQGLAPAQYRLGSLYEKGNGVARDLAMARMWYQRAAEQGHRTAMHNLAVLYADGIGGKPNYEEAAMWFRQASEFGLRDSQYNLAILYARGLGVKRDYAESYRWFSIAADQGDAEAAAKRDEIGGQMDETTLSEIRLALESWQPKPIVEEANRVAVPEGGWDDRPATADAADPATMVQSAQMLLDRLGYEPGPADGRAGERTREAIRSFERESGLPVTGNVTPELLDELNQAAG